MDMALARSSRGYISETIVHVNGPQVEAKKAIKTQTNRMRTCCPARSCTEIVSPTTAIMYSQRHMPIQPTSKRRRRPKRSTPYIPGIVITTLTAFVTMAIMKGSRIPEF